jgi:hypothetical protein
MRSAASDVIIVIIVVVIKRSAEVNGWIDGALNGVFGRFN